MLIVADTFILNYLFESRNQDRAHYIKKIEVYLIEYSQNNPDNSLIFKKKWKNLSYLVPTLQTIDKKIKVPAETWRGQRKTFILKHMLPLARKAARRREWQSQFLAAKTFNLYATEKDESLIKRLMLSKLSAVSLEAYNAIKNVPSKNLINLAITQITKKRRRSYGLYLHVFSELPEHTKEIVSNRLKTERNAYTRDICYRIIMRYKPVSIAEISHRDAYATTIELSLSAIKYIAYSEGQSALPLLYKLINNAPWQRKAVIANILGELKDDSSIPTLANLVNNSSWWTRMNAANALKNLGEHGIVKLNELCKDRTCLGIKEIKYALQEAKS